MSIESTPDYPFGEEVASSVIHGIGLVLSIAGLAVLVAFAAMYGGTRAVVASSVFGSTLILLYTASTLYHSVPGAIAKRVLRTLDHIAIFLLIAGTYTPFTLLALPGAWGWGLFAAVWTLALVGSSLELGLLKRYRKAAVADVRRQWVGWPMVAIQAAGGARELAAAVAARRWPGLHAGRAVLHGAEAAVSPCGLACVRAGRQRAALPGGIALRDSGCARR